MRQHITFTRVLLIYFAICATILCVRLGQLNNCVHELDQDVDNMSDYAQIISQDLQ